MWHIYILSKNFDCRESLELKVNYHQASNISHALIGNKIVDHSDVVGASPVGAAPTASSFLTPGFNILHKDNCKMGRETFEFWDLVWLLLDI